MTILFFSKKLSNMSLNGLPFPVILSFSDMFMLCVVGPYSLSFMVMLHLKHWR